MSTDIILVLGLTAVVIALFASNRIRTDGIAIGALLAVVALGLLSAGEALEAFGNEALVTVAAMFVISAGLTRTGAVAFIGRWILARGGGGPTRLLVVLMSVSALLSTFVNNTPVAVILLPIVLTIARESDTAPSKLLIPMSYATIVGGMATVLGTSTNVLVASLLPEFGQEPLSLFAPLPLAAVGAVVTILYMATIGRRMLPERPTISVFAPPEGVAEYVTEIRVPEGSPLIGAGAVDALAEIAPEARLLRIVRSGLPLPRAEAVLGARDVLLVKGNVNQVLALQRASGIDLTPAGAPSVERRRVTVAELLSRPTAAALGRRVRDLDLPSRFSGLAILALQRHGRHVRESLGDLRLRFGDGLLVQVGIDQLEALRGLEDFVLVESVAERVVLSHRAWRALAIVGAMAALAAFGLASISMLALAAAVLLVFADCLDAREAYRALDLPILVLMAGTLVLGAALERTGAADLLAGGLVGAVLPLGGVAVLSAVYLVCNVLTALISNVGAAVLMLPIALSTAQSAGLSPTPFVIAIMFAASIDFSTPIGYQTNTFVYGPGGYRFSDYVKVGGPLNLLWWFLATALIPLFWPL